MNGLKLFVVATLAAVVTFAVAGVASASGNRLANLNPISAANTGGYAPQAVHYRSRHWRHRKYRRHRHRHYRNRRYYRNYGRYYPYRYKRRHYRRRYRRHYRRHYYGPYYYRPGVYFRAPGFGFHFGY